ncbi:conjugal transfer protein TraF [Isoalcanivorax indicus]|uniref:conjugal transfer protein TraF n=1 Tax=Isoalcanivorax indicus TaxID=2202653 RepID=UPI000DBABEA0|nr:conjugal transfer protein TraF [Isoalcanivorax indicus]
MTRRSINGWAVACALLLPAAVQAAQVDVRDARQAGRGGVGLTFDDSPGRWPAHDIMSLQLGVLASDEDRLLRDVDEFEQELERQQNAVVADGDALADRMEAADGKIAQVDLGGQLTVAPITAQPTLMLRQQTRVGIRFRYDERDRETLNRAANTPGLIDLIGDLLGTPFFERDDIESRVIATGVAVTDLGIRQGWQHDDVNLRLAGTLKYQRVSLLNSSQRASRFDISELLRGAERRHHDTANIDLAALWHSDGPRPLAVAATVENLVPQRFSGPDGVHFHQRPLIAVALGQGGERWQAELGVDVTRRTGYGELDSSRMARVGGEYRVGRQGRVSAGYRHDLDGNVAHTVSLGAGLAVRRLHLDAAVLVGAGDTLGVTAGISWRAADEQ